MALGPNFKSKVQTLTNKHFETYLSDPEKAHMWDVGDPQPIATLLLKTRGRKTGEDRSIPIAYYRDHDRVILVGSYGGLPQHPQWYLNLLETPECEIQVGEYYAHARARTAVGKERERLWGLVCRDQPQFAVYQTRTERQLPIVVLDLYIPDTRPAQRPTLLLKRKGNEGRHMLPLIYHREGEKIVVVTTRNGLPEQVPLTEYPRWYLILQESPECEIQVGQYYAHAIARNVQGKERADLWESACREQPQFKAYQPRIDSLPPIVVFDIYIPDARPAPGPLRDYTPGQRTLSPTFKSDVRVITGNHVQAYLDNPEKAHMWDVGAPELKAALLLQTRGWKTGEKRLVTLSYYRIDEKIIIVGSYGGSPEHPLWYVNLLKNPECEIQVGKFHAHARARTVEGKERADLWEKVCREQYSNYEAYQTRTERQLPVIVLDLYIPDIPVT